MAGSTDDDDLSRPTAYEITEITYTLMWVGAACGERIERSAPQVEWADLDGRAHVFWGTELIIACCPAG